MFLWLTLDINIPRGHIGFLSYPHQTLICFQRCFRHDTLQLICNCAVVKDHPVCTLKRVATLPCESSK